MAGHRLKVLLMQSALVILVILFWEIGSKVGWINEFFASSPSNIVRTIIEICLSGELFGHIGTTFIEIVLAFSLGIIIALLVAIMMYRYKTIANILDPFLTMLNSMPKVALGPIIIIWIGANKNSIVTMALLTNVFVSISTIYHGFIHTDSVKIKMFKSFGATNRQILKSLVIPANLSTIMNTIKVSISLTLIGVIMGEFLVSKKGIGYLITYGTQVFNLNLVMSGIVILVILSVLLYSIISFIEKHLN